MKITEFRILFFATQFAFSQGNILEQMTVLVTKINSTNDNDKIEKFKGEILNDETEQDNEYYGFKTKENLAKYSYSWNVKRGVNNNTISMEAYYKKGILVVIMRKELDSNGGFLGNIAYYPEGKFAGFAHLTKEAGSEAETKIESLEDLSEGEKKLAEKMYKMFSDAYKHYFSSKFEPEMIK